MHDIELDVLPSVLWKMQDVSCCVGILETRDAHRKPRQWLNVGTGNMDAKIVSLQGRVVLHLSNAVRYRDNFLDGLIDAEKTG